MGTPITTLNRGLITRRRVTTEDALDDALVCAKAMTDGPALIEIMLERFDTSEALKRLGAALSPQKGERDDPSL